MNPITVGKVDGSIIVRFTNDQVALPAEIQHKIDAYWESLIAAGKSYTRGEVFTVTQVTHLPQAKRS